MYRASLGRAKGDETDRTVTRRSRALRVGSCRHRESGLSLIQQEKDMSLFHSGRRRNYLTRPLCHRRQRQDARFSSISPYFHETGRPSPMRLPNSDSILRLKIELVAGRGLVLVVPGIDIAHGIASIFSRRMRISVELLTKGSFGLELAPSLGKRQKETLFSIQSIDNGIGLAFQGQNVSVMRHG